VSFDTGPRFVPLRRKPKFEMTQDLKSHLWECAEILRGSAVDRTDWKAYILPLLFFKRISDVWDEETVDAAALFGDAEPVDFPEVRLMRDDESRAFLEIQRAAVRGLAANDYPASVTEEWAALPGLQVRY
jgi:hypothetical protein